MRTISAKANKSRPVRWQALSKYREAERTLTEWTRHFAGFQPADFPLIKIVGSRADFIRCPDTEIPLEIFANVDGSFSARPPPDKELDTRFDGLTIEDLRLYRLDWPALCREVAHDFGLAGMIRDMPDLPWFWRIGDLQTVAVFYPYFLAVIREDPDADIVGKALKSKPEARLIVPNLSDVAYNRLAELNIRFHVLAEGTPPQFPDVAKPSTASALAPSGNETPLKLAKKLEEIADTTAKTLKQVEIMRPHIKGAPTLGAKVAKEFQEYVFRHTGDFWEIVYEGRQLQPVRHLAGMTYIHKLLSRPGIQISALDLYEIENPPPPQVVAPPAGNVMAPEECEKYGTGGSHQTILDKTTPAKLKKAHAALKAKLTDPELSEKQREYFEDQQAAIVMALSNGRVARGTGGMTFENKATKQPRQAVSKSIEAAFDALAKMKHGQELVKHLRYAVRKGNTFMYPPGLSWQT